MEGAVDGPAVGTTVQVQGTFSGFTGLRMKAAQVLHPPGNCSFNKDSTGRNSQASEDRSKDMCAPGVNLMMMTLNLD